MYIEIVSLSLFQRFSVCCDVGAAGSGAAGAAGVGAGAGAVAVLCCAVLTFPLLSSSNS